MLIFVRLILFPPLTFDTYSTFYFDFDFLFTLWFFIFIQNFSSLCFCYILTYIQQLSMHIYILYVCTYIIVSIEIYAVMDKSIQTQSQQKCSIVGTKNFDFWESCRNQQQCRPHTKLIFKYFYKFKLIVNEGI